MILKEKLKLVRFLESFCCILSTLFWIFMLFSFEEKALAITSIICSLIHELGHFVCIILVSKNRLGFRGTINGFRIKNNGLHSYQEELMIYLSGPFANVFSFTICLILSFIANKNFVVIGIIHLLTALSNLIPIKGYDGYGAISAIIKNHGNSDKALHILSCISSALIFTFCVCSLYLIDRQGGGYWIFAVFFVSMIKEFKEGLEE